MTNQNTNTTVQSIRRHAISIAYAFVTISLGAYAWNTQLDQIENIYSMIDCMIFCVLLCAHVITLIEAIAKHRQADLVQKDLYKIVARLSDFDIDIRQDCKAILITSYAYAIVCVCIVTGGITLTGWKTWRYYGYSVLSEMCVGVRLLEVSSYLDILEKSMGGLEKRIVQHKSSAENLAYVNEMYTKFGGLCKQICALFEWSILAILVLGLNGMASAMYWVFYSLLNGVTL